MEILDTIISREIDTIANSSQPNIAHKWKLIIKANGREINALYVDNVKLDRLYAINFADELRLTAGFVSYDFYQNILPYKETLEATLIKIPMKTHADSEEDKSRQISTNIFRAQLMDGGSPIIEGDTPLAISKEQGKTAEISEVSLQLYNPVLDYIRKKEFGTTFRKTVPMDAVKYILAKITKPATADASVNIEGVDIAPGFSTDIREHLPLSPSPIAALPYAINDLVGGLYPTGFHTYLQNKIWYVYPPYDNTRFDKTDYTLTLIKIPKNRMPSLERTFRLTKSQLIVLTTRETIHRDMSESNQLNTGNGIRFVDADKIMGEYAKVGGNKAIISAKGNVNEVVSEEREDGNMVLSTQNLISNDYNKEYSKLALKSGSVIQTVWENCILELLYPGMPVRYIFSDGDQSKELFGTLNAVEGLDYKPNINMGEPKFVSIALLTIFVSKVNPMKQPSFGAVTNSKATSG